MVGLSALSADRAVSVGGEHLGVDVCHVEDATGERKHHQYRLLGPGQHVESVWFYARWFRYPDIYADEQPHEHVDPHVARRVRSAGSADASGMT